MFKKNKKGLSQIVSTLLIILLTIVLIGVTWGTINNFLDSNLNKDKASCLDMLEKVQLNPEYTYYNETSGEVFVSIRVGNVEKISAILVGIIYEDSSKTFLLEETDKSIEGVHPYEGSEGDNVTMPKQESLRTFVVTEAKLPLEIQISPKIGNTQCSVTDSLKIIQIVS